MIVQRRFAALVALFASAAGAEEPKQPAKQEPAPTGDRGGLVVAVGGGLAMGTASGFPNDLQKIDDPNFYGAGGFMLGQSSALYVMGAFAPVVNFGLWAGQGAMWSTSGRWRSPGYGGGFRVELFPFGWLHPALHDLGVAGQFGVGAGELDANQGAYPGADGVQSYIAFGTFYEWRFARVGKTRWVIGPSLEYQLIVSRPFERSNAMIGLRFAFYTGQ